MTQKEQQLLLKDLCARLPYGVKVVYLATTYSIQYVDSKFDEVKLEGIPYTVGIGYIKPYLRPMSSMTEEEKQEIKSLCEEDLHDKAGDIIKGDCLSLGGNYHFHEKRQFEWCNKKHFDYNGLIEKGLAIEAPEDLYEEE